MLGVLPCLPVPARTLCADAGTCAGVQRGPGRSRALWSAVRSYASSRYNKPAIPYANSAVPPYAHCATALRALRTPYLIPPCCLHYGVCVCVVCVLGGPAAGQQPGGAGRGAYRSRLRAMQGFGAAGPQQESDRQQGHVPPRSRPPPVQVALFSPPFFFLVSAFSICCSFVGFCRFLSFFFFCPRRLFPLLLRYVL